MKVNVDDFETGWIGVGIGLSLAEIDSLIEQLQNLRTDPTHHFHASSSYRGSGGVGDIEFYVVSNQDEHNTFLDYGPKPDGLKRP